MPILWLAQLTVFLNTSQSKPKRTAIRTLGIIVMLVGLALIHPISADYIKTPVFKVAVGILGLVIALLGVFLMMIPKKPN